MTWDGSERRHLMVEMQVAIARMDENVKTIRTWTDNHDCDHKGFDGRIGALEQWKWRWAGAVTVGVFIITIAVNFLTRLAWR